MSSGGVTCGRVDYVDHFERWLVEPLINILSERLGSRLLRWAQAIIFSRKVTSNNQKMISDNYCSGRPRLATVSKYSSKKTLSESIPK